MAFFCLFSFFFVWGIIYLHTLLSSLALFFVWPLDEHIYSVPFHSPHTRIHLHTVSDFAGEKPTENLHTATLSFRFCTYDFQWRRGKNCSEVSREVFFVVDSRNILFLLTLSPWRISIYFLYYSNEISSTFMSLRSSRVVNVKFPCNEHGTMNHFFVYLIEWITGFSENLLLAI